MKCFVIRYCDLYLDGDLIWGENENTAFLYPFSFTGAIVALIDAIEYGGEVYLRKDDGTEILIFLLLVLGRRATK